MLAVWIALNITAYVSRWDPHSFILLNLAMSFQAAYYEVNLKAELEIM